MSAYSFYPGSPSFLAMKYQRTYTPRTQLEPGERYRLRRNMEVQVRIYFTIRQTLSQSDLNSTIFCQFSYLLCIQAQAVQIPINNLPYNDITKRFFNEIFSRLHIFTFSKMAFERSKRKEFSKLNTFHCTYIQWLVARNSNGLSFENAPMYPNTIA